MTGIKLSEALKLINSSLVKIYLRPKDVNESLSLKFSNLYTFNTEEDVGYQHYLIGNMDYLSKELPESFLLRIIDGIYVESNVNELYAERGDNTEITVKDSELAYFIGITLEELYEDHESDH